MDPVISVEPRRQQLARAGYAAGSPGSGGLPDDLFPVAPAQSTSGGAIAALVTGVVVLAALSVLRQAGISSLDTVWAEDGPTFLQEAIAWPPSERLLTTYAGYLHIVPRVLAELVTIVPVARAATALTLVAATAVAVCALLVFVATAGHIRSVPVRAALGAAVVLHPLAAVETLNSLALLQWHMTFTAVWLVLWRPVGRAAVIIQAVGIALAILSSPVALIVLPVLALRTLLLRDPRSWALAATAGLAAAGQLTALATAPAVPPMSTSSSGGLGLALVIAEVFGLRVAAATILGPGTTAALVNATGRGW